MNRISFASGIAPECGPVETIQAASAGGFDATGLWVDPDAWSAQTTRDARHALADSGLDLLDVEVIWIKPDHAISRNRSCHLIAAASVRQG